MSRVQLTRADANHMMEQIGVADVEAVRPLLAAMKDERYVASAEAYFQKSFGLRTSRLTWRMQDLQEPHALGSISAHTPPGLGLAKSLVRYLVSLRPFYSSLHYMRLFGAIQTNLSLCPSATWTIGRLYLLHRIRQDVTFDSIASSRCDERRYPHLSFSDSS